MFRHFACGLAHLCYTVAMRTDHRPRPALRGLIRPPGPPLLVWLLPLVAMLVACTGTLGPTTTPAPTATPTVTATPVPTWTPTPTPTATPVPSARLEIHWPEQVSPLEPVALVADLIPPPGLAVIGHITVTVMDPARETYQTFDLSQRDGDRFSAREALQFPLVPQPGTWWLISHVKASLPVVGERAFFFEVEPVALRELSGTLPAAVTLQVPAGFEEVVAAGDLAAGGRVWAHAGGEVGLWWAPGPTEPLLVSNALVVLEATHAGDARYAPPTVSEVIETTWQERVAFEFPETWPGPDGGPGRAWVIKGDNHWLYVLRVRAVGAPAIPPLIEEVGETFGFTEPNG